MRQVDASLTLPYLAQGHPQVTNHRTDGGRVYESGADRGKTDAS